MDEPLKSDRYAFGVTGDQQLATLRALIEILREPSQQRARLLLKERYSPTAVQRMLAEAVEEQAELSEVARRRASDAELTTAALLQRVTGATRG